MFWLEEGLASSLIGGVRPRTTLSPSLARRDDGTVLAFGTPGGDQQDQWSFEFFLAHAVFGLNLQEAIDAPMFHSNHFPSSFYPRVAAPGRGGDRGARGRRADRRAAGARPRGRRHRRLVARAPVGDLALGRRRAARRREPPRDAGVRGRALERWRACGSSEARRITKVATQIAESSR